MRRQPANIKTQHWKRENRWHGSGFELEQRPILRHPGRLLRRLRALRATQQHDPRPVTTLAISSNHHDSLGCPYLFNVYRSDLHASHSPPHICWRP